MGRSIPTFNEFSLDKRPRNGFITLAEGIACQTVYVDG